MDADPMTKADPIPPPSEDDLKIDLRGHWLSIRAHETYSNAHYEGNRKAYLILGAIIRRCHAAEAEVARLLAAIKTHHDQRADDRCWLDDAELYKTAGLPPHDNSVGDKVAMLKNCERFLEVRCTGGTWQSYASLEAENARLRAEVERLEKDLTHQKHIVSSYTEVRQMLADDIVALGTGRPTKLELSCGADRRIATLTAERDEALAAARKAGEQRDAAVKVLESIRDHVCVEPCKRCQEGAKIIVAAIRNLPLGKGDVS